MQSRVPAHVRELARTLARARELARTLAHARERVRTLVRPTAALALVAVVVVAGCAGPVGPLSPPGTPDATPPADAPATPTVATGTADATDTRAPDGASPGATATDGPGTPTAAPSTVTETPRTEPRPDPPNDTLGWEAGYWYDDPVAANETDGLNDTELAAVTRRTMARVERIRSLEFTANVTVEFVSRSDFAAGEVFRFTEDRWRDQYWEAAFVVGENRTAAAAYTELYDAVVDGYYTGDRIVLVRERADSPRVDTGTLAHELGHAATDQAIAWDFASPNRDASLAARAVVEGDPNSLNALYRQRCRANWSCLEPAGRAGSPDGLRSVNLGLYVRFAMPYTVGPEFVAALRADGGWAAVNAAYSDGPASTEQVLHPEAYGTEPPVDVAVPDRSGPSWERFGHRGAQTGTFGEATLYATLLQHGVIDAGPPEFNVAQRTGLNYTAPATAGWGGDRVVPYTNGTAYGYVWASVWDTERDAREFHAAYVALLRSEGAVEVREGVYRVPDGPFADAFRVVRDGRRLVVTNAPRVDQLDDVRTPE